MYKNPIANRSPEHALSEVRPTEKRRKKPTDIITQVERPSSARKLPHRFKQPLLEFFYSLLVGAGAFILFFSCGYWLFAEPNPQMGRVGGWILAPVMGILFFAFAWGYFGQRRRMPE